MSEYALYERELGVCEEFSAPTHRRLVPVPSIRDARGPKPSTEPPPELFGAGDAIDRLVEQVVHRIAAAVVQRMADEQPHSDEWLDSRHAAEYLGVHRDTLRKLGAERAIPAEQDGPGCKLYFRRSDLDAWRRSGGKPRRVVARVASGSH